jgi:hypothetical protein
MTLQGAEQLSDRGGYDFGLVRQPSPCDAENAIAGELKDGVTRAIPLECRAGSVEGPAIELHHQPALDPNRIHQVALDEHVERWWPM